MSTPSPAEFMASAAAPAMSGSSPWAQRYANMAKAVVRDYAELMPRNLQEHLGPSEIGVECDRQVVSKLVGAPKTNHVVDVWPSFVGTALHVAEAAAFDAWNVRNGELRFVTETRVYPDDEHSGTADLYDAKERAVVDHKNLGETTMAKLRNVGPPIHYIVQLLAYGRGYRKLGLPVDRVAIAAWPRTGSSLDGLYVWDRPYSAADDELLDSVFGQMQTRRLMADLVRRGLLRLDQVPVTPSDDGCYFCDFYRPESARDGGPGCPGNRAIQPQQPSTN